MTRQWTIGLAAAVLLFSGGVGAQTAAPPQTVAAPPSTIAIAAPPQAKVETSLGTFTITLDRVNAPRSVANFISYANEHHFDGTTIYRVAPGFVIQMGSIEANGNSRPTNAAIPLESGNGLKNVRGSVSMARQDDPNSATAEFFVNLADNPALDADAAASPNTTGYAVFGRVSDGMDVVDKIAAVPLGGRGGPFPPSATPAAPVVLRKVTVVQPSAPNPPGFAR